LQAAAPLGKVTYARQVNKGKELGMLSLQSAFF